MKLKSLCTVVWRGLFVFFVLEDGLAVAVNLSPAPLGYSVGGIVSADLHVRSDIHDPQHVDDVGIGRLKNEVPLLGFLHEVNLKGVLMTPVLQSGLNGQLANLGLRETVAVPSGDYHAKNTSDQSPENETDTASKCDKEFQLIIGQAINKCLQHFLFGMVVVGPLGLLIGYVAGNWWMDRNERRSLNFPTNV